MQPSSIFCRAARPWWPQRSALLGLIVLARLIAGVVAVFVTVETRRHALEPTGQNAALWREVAERERTEGQVRQAQMMNALGQLTGGIAHYFNNKRRLSWAISTWPCAADGDQALQGILENARAGANCAAALTRRLLASRLGSLDPSRAT